jgi:DNA-directed RNA polymerase specialized sigma24 family protein
MDTALTDAELHRRWTRDRDQGAARELHLRSSRIVAHRLAKRLFSLPDAAQEAAGLADEAYLRALAAYNPQHGSFRSFWATVAENLAMDVLRKRSGYTLWCLRLLGAVLETRAGRSKPRQQVFPSEAEAAAAGADARLARQRDGYVPKAEQRKDGWSCHQRVYGPDSELAGTEAATEPPDDTDAAETLARVRAFILSNWSEADYDAVMRSFDDVPWAKNAELHPDQPSPDALRMRVRNIVRRAREES